MGGNLNVCMGPAEHFISVASKPAVKVCGNGIKMTVYLLGRCGEGSLTGAHLAHTWTVGACDTGAPPSTCASFSPPTTKGWVQLRVTRSLSAELFIGVVKSFALVRS